MLLTRRPFLQARNFGFAMCCFSIVIQLRQGHLRLFHYIPRIDTILLALNFVDLGASCLLPFATISFSKHLGSSLAARLFGSIVCMMTLARLAILYWARHCDLLVQPPPPRAGKPEALAGDPVFLTAAEAFAAQRVRLFIFLFMSFVIIGLGYAVGNAGAAVLYAFPLGPAVAKHIPLEIFKPLRHYKQVSWCGT